MFDTEGIVPIALFLARSMRDVEYYSIGSLIAGAVVARAQGVALTVTSAIGITNIFGLGSNSTGDIHGGAGAQ